MIQEALRPKFPDTPLPLGMKEFIEKCWAQNSDERPTAKEALALLQAIGNHFISLEIFLF